MTRVVKEPAKTLNEEKVGQLWELVKASRKKHQKFFEDCDHASDLVSKGSFGELSGIDQSDWVIANLAHSHVKTKLPTVFFKNPSVNVMPTHPSNQKKAATWGQVLNNTIKKIDFKKEVTKAIRDAIIYPEGWIKTGLNLLVEDDPENLESGPGMEMSNDKGPVSWMDKESPVVSRISAKQVVVDYMSGDRSLDGARFVDIMYKKSLTELKKDPKYSRINLTRDETIDPHVIESSEFSETSSNFDTEKAKDKYVILHEIWVYQIPELGLYKQLVVLIEGSNDTVQKNPIRFTSDGHIPEWTDILGKAGTEYPLSRLVFNEVSDRLPRSDIQILSSLQTATNWLMTRIVSSIEGRKQFFMLDTTKVDKVDQVESQFKKKGNIRELIKVRGSDAILPVANHQSPRDESLMMNLVLEMMRRVGGVSENKLGGDNFRTATAASQAAQSDAIKTSFDQDLVSDFLKDSVVKIARMIISIVERAGNTEFVLNIGGDTGAVEWLRFTPSDIAWMPEIDVQVDSFIKPTREEQAQKGLMAMQAMLQGIPAGVTGRLDILLKQVFEALEIKDIHKILDNSQDHVILQAVELSMLVAGVDVPINPDDNHALHIQVIDQFLNSPQVQQVQAENPDALSAILVHRDQHEQALQGSSDGGGIGPKLSSADNVFNVVNPANQARADTAREREATNLQRIPGSGGQF